MASLLRVLAGLLLVSFALVAGTATAGAIVPDPDPRGTAPPDAELVVSGTGAGQSVQGSVAPSTFDPLTGYPAAPPAGSTPANQSFAGIIRGRTPSGAELNLYCIDILTPTQIGLGYELGEWSASNVPNVGYVARLLNGYYPNTTLPALANNNQRAAAVQAAIWFFSDRYVLAAGDPLRSAVAAIVADVIAAGPLVEPPAPTVDVAPPASTSGPIGTVVGPFTITSNQPAVTVSATGGEMFADAAGTVPIANGSALPAGSSVWLGSTSAGPVTLRAEVSLLIESGTVYLYAPADPANPNPADAQTLILAQQSVATRLDDQTATFFDQGSLQVVKEISGDGAPFRGPITLQVVCPGALDESFVIPAGTPGPVSQTFGPFPTPMACVVNEVVDGADPPNVTVVVTGSGQTVVIPQNTDPDDVVTATLTDVYTAAPGSLTVRKVIEGPGAGQQGVITITIDCGAALQTTITIPAGQTAPVEETFDDLPAGTECTVTETGGDVPAPFVRSLEPPETVVVPPGGNVVVEFVNSFAPPTTTTAPTTTVPTTSVPGPTTTTTPVSPTSVGPTTTNDPGTLPDTGGGSLPSLLVLALTMAGLGCIVAAWALFPRLDHDDG